MTRFRRDLKGIALCLFVTGVLMFVLACCTGTMSLIMPAVFVTLTGSVIIIVKDKLDRDKNGI